MKNCKWSTVFRPRHLVAKVPNPLFPFLSTNCQTIAPVSVSHCQTIAPVSQSKRFLSVSTTPRGNFKYDHHAW